jgi:hypothetical protein
MNLLDIFSGRTGGQGVQPVAGGAGDGGKKAAVDQWLGFLTGAYEAVTGSGTKGGPAPAPAAVQTKPKSNLALWVGIAAVLVVGIFLLARKR